MAAQSPPPVHDLHAAAGGGPQAAVQLRPHHAGGPGPLRVRLHHLHAHRFHHPLRRGAGGGPRSGAFALRPGLPAGGAPPLRQEGEKRPGSPRGHPPGGRHLPDAGPDGAARRPAPPLRAGVDADGGLPDGRCGRPERAGAAGGASRRTGGRSLPGHRRRVRHQREGHNLPRLPAGLRGGQRRPRGRPGGPGSPAAAPPPRPAPVGAVHATRRPRHLAPRPLHRGVAGQGPGGPGGGPALHLRQHHRCHPGSRLRVEEGRRPDSLMDGVRGGHPPRAALRPPGRLRLHRLHGGGARRDRPRGRGTRALAAALLFRGTHQRVGGRFEADGLGPVGGDRRPGDQLHPHRGARGRPGGAGGPLRALRPAGRRPGLHPRGPAARRADTRARPLPAGSGLERAPARQ